MSNNSKMVQDRAIVTIVDKLKVVYAILNDLERPLAPFSKSSHSLMLDI